MYYTERVKATFEERYPAMVESWEKRKNAAEAKGKNFTEKRPAVVSSRNKITREFFENEDAETKAVVEKLYQEEKAGEQDTPASVFDFDTPKTPQQYHEYVVISTRFMHALIPL